MQSGQLTTACSKPSLEDKSSTDATPTIGDEYVLIRKGISEKGLLKPTLVRSDVKESSKAASNALITASDASQSLAPAAASKLKMLLRGPTMKAKSSSGRPRTTRVMLVQVLAVANTAASTNATVASVDPINSTDFASIASLFDEVRVKRFKFHHSPCSYAQLSATTGGNHGGSIGVDFTRLTAAASYGDNADEDLQFLYDTGIYTTGIGVTKECRNVSSEWIKPPSIAINPLPSATQYQFVGDNWALTSGTTTALCANLKFYELNSLNSGGTVGKLTIWMDCEFRCRD